MGRTKSHVDPELTFVPKISDRSRKLALLKIYNKGLKGDDDDQSEIDNLFVGLQVRGRLSNVPNFMKTTISRRESVTKLAPLKRVPQATPAAKSKKILFSRKANNFAKNDNASNFSNLSLRIAKEKGAKIHAEIMAKAAAMPSPTSSRVVDDTETFTFKPKVSSRSASIAESLGTDFMARNQQHIEKQKKLLDQSISNHRTINPYTGRLSPVVHTKVNRKTGKTKEGADANASLAWSTTDSTKILTAASSNRENEGSPARVTRSGTTLSPLKHPNKSQSSVAFGGKSLINSPYNTTYADLVFKKKSSKKTVGIDSDTDDDDELSPRFARSKTMPPQHGRLSKKSITSINLDRLKNAKLTAEKAMKHRKIFTIQGPYSVVRKSLRRRGWVEKFYKPSHASQKKTPRGSKSKEKNDNSDDDDDDVDDDDDDDDPTLDAMKNDENVLPPWEEEDGLYGIMSRIVRNCSPTFIWCIRRDALDYRFLNKDQMVNHYCKAGSFTTKVGLCVNLRNVMWYDNVDSSTFFPRCYKLCVDEEKFAFIDDFRLTACQSIIQHVIEKYGGRQSPETIEEEDEEGKMDKKGGEKAGGKGESSTPSAPTPPCMNSDCTGSRPGSVQANPSACSHSSSPDEGKVVDEKEEVAQELSELHDTATGLFNQTSRPKKQQCASVGMRIIDQAIQQCERWLAFKAHQDIDRWDDPYLLSDSVWEQLLQSYYRIVHDGAMITNAASRVQECEAVANKIREHNPQFVMGGTKNVWIVKPGAKSRGRGIMVFDNLDEMCKLVSSTVGKREAKYVVQKYIERPLLVYNTKFDMRQWFLVTDWNPLTLWFYKECYIRFCSQQFTLENFNEAIHLSNFSIQKHYSNGPRSKSLPRDNMWDSETFKQYLAMKGQGQAWDDKIYPGMKKSVICALLATQDVVEYRKASFELYGADFMLTEDLNPWLIEINSSPTMAASTPVTTRLCNSVIEDTMKVVIDRKYDKNCDTGGYELAFKQNPVIIPPYIGINLSVEGQAIRKPYSCLKNSSLEESPYMQKQTPPKPFAPGKIAPSSTPSQTQTQTPVKYSMTHAKTPPMLGIKPISETSTTSSSGKKKDSTSSVKASNSKEENSKAESESTSTKDDSVVSTKTENKKTQRVSLDNKVLLVDRERLPMKMTHVTAADYKPVKMGNKGTGAPISDGVKAGRPCALCGNGKNLHLDSSSITCKCRQDSLCIDLSNQRSKSANTPASMRIQSFITSRSPSVTIPRDHLASVYKQEPTNYAVKASRRVLGYTDAGIKRPKSPLRISPKALPNLIRRMQSRKNGLLNMAPMYQHSREYSIVRSTFPNYQNS